MKTRKCKYEECQKTLAPQVYESGRVERDVAFKVRQYCANKCFQAQTKLEGLRSRTHSFLTDEQREVQKVLDNWRAA